MQNTANTDIRAIIWDHDGTLVQSELTHWGAWNQAIKEYDKALSVEDYINHLSGVPSIESARWIIKHLELDTQAQALLDNKVAILQNQLKQIPYPLCDGAIGLIQRLRPHFPLAIASGASRDEVMSSIKGHKLEPFFSVICTKEDVVSNKPAPDIFLLTAQRLGVAPQHCLAIEDSDTGELAAQAAGMRCLRLNTPSRLAPSREREIIQTLNEVAARLGLNEGAD